MSVLFFAGVTVAYGAEARAQPRAAPACPSTRALGNMEGKEVRFGIANSALFATVTTDASCGAVNAMHDSFTPLGGLVPLVNIMLGEVIFGGVGAGPLRDAGDGAAVGVHRRADGRPHARVPGQEDRGARDEAAMLYVLDLPADHPGLRRPGRRSPATAPARSNNAGPHGLSEILYAFTSGAGNNGSAFAGLNANTPFYNIDAGPHDAGRPLPDDRPGAWPSPARCWARRRCRPGPGTFPTNGVAVLGAAGRR